MYFNYNIYIQAYMYFLCKMVKLYEQNHVYTYNTGHYSYYLATIHIHMTVFHIHV